MFSYQILLICTAVNRVVVIIEINLYCQSLTELLSFVMPCLFVIDTKKPRQRYFVYNFFLTALIFHSSLTFLFLCFITFNNLSFEFGLLFSSYFCMSNQHFNLRSLQILIQDIKNVCLSASCSHLYHVVRTQHVSPNSQTVSLLLEYKRNDSVNAKNKNPNHIQSAVVWPFPLDKKGVLR